MQLKEDGKSAIGGTLVESDAGGKAVLFIFWNNHKYNSTSCTATKPWECYNLLCPGFQQRHLNWFLGGIWDHYSTINGDQWGPGL
jgi:hypothetical protein